MNLRKKTILIIFFTVFSLIVILYIPSKVILGDGFARLEERYVHENVQRALSGLEDRISHMSTLAADWAKWDDTYNYIKDENEEYVQSNLVDTTFSELGINVMLFINNANKVVYAKGFDIELQKQVPVSEELLNYVSSKDILLKHNGEEDVIEGIINLSSGCMMVVARPILNSSGEGPIRGTLITARYIDEVEIKELAGSTRLSIQIHNLVMDEMNPDIKNAFLVLKEKIGENPITIHALNKNSIAGYTVVKDLFNQPVFIMKIELPRSIDEQGRASIKFFTISLLLCSVIIGAIIMLLLEKLVIARLSTLSKGISNIGLSQNISSRLEVLGKDELASLAVEVNRMLEALEKAQADIRAAKEEAERANQYKSMFLANMSHEIRTPMNAIIGMTELLIDTSLDKKQYHLASTVREAGELLLNVINDVLDYSKIEAGKLVLNKSEFNVMTLIEGIADMLTLKVREKGLSLITFVSPDIPLRIIGDADRLRQVLLNLLSNAIKFTPKGEINLHVSMVSIDHPLCTLLFEVKDTGIGISENVQKSLFEPFVQADATTTKKYGGTGLGLSICKRLIDLMEGSIGINSKEGTGSTFWFSIPFEYVREPLRDNETQLFDGFVAPIGKIGGCQGEELNAVEGRNKDHCILLAEDNPVNQELAIMQLEKLGYKVVTVPNGREAVEAVKNGIFSLVLMDGQMPEMDGFMATEAIRRMEVSTGKHIPIVAMTANAMQGDREKCLAAGMDDYITKPVRVKNLKEVLDWFLPD